AAISGGTSADKHTGLSIPIGRELSARISHLPVASRSGLGSSRDSSKGSRHKVASTASNGAAKWIINSRRKHLIAISSADCGALSTTHNRVVDTASDRCPFSYAIDCVSKSASDGARIGKAIYRIVRSPANCGMVYVNAIIFTARNRRRPNKLRMNVD